MKDLNKFRDDYKWVSGQQPVIPNIHMTINYGSEEPYGFNILYKCVKLFIFKHIPIMPCKIILDNDVIKVINFADVSFDPNKNIYHVTNRNSENLQRYYTGDREEIANMTIDNFVRFGWLIAKQ